MNVVTLGVGVLAIGFGIYTLILRSKNPAKLKKLEAMKAKFGEGPGTIIHVAAYSIAPICFGLAMVFAGVRGVAIF